MPRRAAVAQTRVSESANGYLALYLSSLFILDRQAAGADIDVQALGLVTILIKLVANHGDHDHQRADNQIKQIVACHDSESPSLIPYVLADNGRNGAWYSRCRNYRSMAG